MCYDEQEQCYEPSEFDIKINNLIGEEVESKIKQTVEDLKYLQVQYDELNKKYCTLLCEHNSKVSEHKKEIKKVAAETKKEVECSMFNGFTAGDTCFYPKVEIERKDCPKCNGKGKVEANILGEIKVINCPFCKYGNGKLEKYIHTPKQTKITHIRLEMTDSGKKYLKFWIKDAEYETDKIFKTIEECEKYCQEMKQKGNYK